MSEPLGFCCRWRMWLGRAVCAACPRCKQFLPFIAAFFLLSSCAELDHKQIAGAALQKLCYAPSDGLAQLLPQSAQREALARLCAVIGFTPRLSP